MHKLTTAYVLFIIIPLLCISFLTYRQLINNKRQEVIKRDEVTLNRIVENITNKMNIIGGISENISSNPRLIRFLKNDYSSYSIEEYKYFISPIFEYSTLIQKINTHSIRIYMVSKEIEESPSVFFHEEWIKGQEWYKTFMSSKEKSIWLGPQNIDALHGIASNKSRFVFSHIEKMYAEDGTYLGILVINIYQDEIFSSLKRIAEENQELFVLNKEQVLIFENHPREIKKQGMETLKKVDALNTYIGVKSNVPIKLDVSTTFFIYTVLFGVLSLLAIFYLLLNRIFGHINKQIVLMNQSIDSDFNQKIPVDRKDELGDLSRGFNALVDKINCLIKDIVVKETAQKDANLKALQYQINPHFIYNTIDIFGSTMEINGHYEVADAITDFGKMIRYNMSDSSMFTTLGEEIEQIKRYINIEKLKYGNRLNVFFDCPEDIKDVEIIKFLLQPIVENSVIHGYTDQIKVLRIYIKVRLDSKILTIEVADDGVGMGKDRMEKLNNSFRYSDYSDALFRKTHGIGLKNINERVKIFYGEKCFIRLCSKRERFIETLICIPISYR